MGEDAPSGASALLDWRDCEEEVVPQSLRPKLDQALREEAEALQLAARLIASRASYQEYARLMHRVEELRSKRIAIQREIEERRRKQDTLG
jgi:hypothetical protein